MGKAAQTAQMKDYTNEEFESLLALARPREIHLLRRWWKTYRLHREGKTLVELSTALGIRREAVKLHLARLSARLKSLDRWRGLLNQIGSEVPPRKLPEVSFACSLHGNQSGKMVETDAGTLLRLGCGCEFIPIRGYGFQSVELSRRIEQSENGKLQPGQGKPNWLGRDE